MTSHIGESQLTVTNVANHYLHDHIINNFSTGLDLESFSHSRENVQCFETRLRIIFLALIWRNEIEIIIWSFSYFETRTRLHIVILMFRDEIETLENHFSVVEREKMNPTLVENSQDQEFSLTSGVNACLYVLGHLLCPRQNWQFLVLGEVRTKKIKRHTQKNKMADFTM